MLHDAQYEVIFTQRDTGPRMEKPGSKHGILFWQRGPVWQLSWEAQVQLEHWFRSDRDCNGFYLLTLEWTDNRTLWKHPHRDETVLVERHNNASAIRYAIREFDELRDKLQAPHG